MNQVSYSDRRNTILIIVIAIAFIFTIRLFYIQVISDKWKSNAINVSEAKLTIHPSRGLIFDRNGDLLALNKPAYKLYVTPRQIKELDTTQLSELLEIPRQELDSLLKDLRKHPKTKQLLKVRIPLGSISRLQAIMYRLEGFELRDQSARSYPAHAGAHILGYIREVDQKKIEKDPYYRPGDLVGISGLELYYEELLRGIRGKDYVLKDAYGNLKEIVSTDSAYAGQNITTTIDKTLQLYGEKLMQNKIGSIVAIEPKTGEILAMVSAPNFDPNLLTGEQVGKNYTALFRNDTTKPLINRPLLSQYPPGSIFKMVQGLISLEMGAININTGLPCNKGLVGCHNHPMANSLPEAIKYSCNPYFFQTLGLMAFKTEGKDIHEKSWKSLKKWKEYVHSFGLGSDLKTDVPYMNKGSIPGPKYYDKMYKGMKWNYRTCNSISIGQGEMLITPIQMANLAAVFANRGYFYYPHLVKEFSTQPIDSIYKQKNYAKVNQKYFPMIADAMQQVVEGVGGTARLARIDSITVCGKTGTAQNPHGKDHSVFIAFAPKDDPKIAIAVFIENAGFGGTWAAPTASLMIEQYLTDTIKDHWKEQRILDANLIPSYD